MALKELQREQAAVKITNTQNNEVLSRESHAQNDCGFLVMRFMMQLILQW